MNSTAYANRAISPFRRFNSQRIELFHIPAGRYKMQWQKFQFPMGWNSTQLNEKDKRARGAFQFPTGWNSTISFEKIWCQWWSVSIPNGMEFYIGEKIDWILSSVFQFPTGWNSTLLSLSMLVIRCSFNSQRDGILRCRCCSDFPNSFTFQFPTGWNSTLSRYAHKNTQSSFQFPTGWNSTPLGYQ